jgi:molybdate transport system substrate-binding protein
LTTACGSGSSATPTETVTVFAAASLTRAFTAEGRAFEAAHPGVRVTFSFAGSQALVAQVQQGAPASVLATADPETIAKVRAELAAEPEVLAHNQLAIVTAPGNPKHVTTATDLARPGIRVVLADPAVPVGKAAAKALAAAGVRVQPVSLEDAVTGVVTKVRLGEADAGIAYATDLVGSGVAGTPLAGTTTALAIAPLEGASRQATAFVAFVLGAEGQRVLRSFGFS